MFFPVVHKAHTMQMRLWVQAISQWCGVSRMCSWVKQSLCFPDVGFPRLVFTIPGPGLTNAREHAIDCPRSQATSWRAPSSPFTPRRWPRRSRARARSEARLPPVAVGGFHPPALCRSPPPPLPAGAMQYSVGGRCGCCMFEWGYAAGRTGREGLARCLASQGRNGMPAVVGETRPPPQACHVTGVIRRVLRDA
jgi:hypothetical protein